MNTIFDFRQWNTNDDQDTKLAAGIQDTNQENRNLGTQTTATLYVYYNILNWFSEDELCTLLGYAYRNHNVKQAIQRMVERDMLTSQKDSAGTGKYYLSKWSSEFMLRSPEDDPDIETVNPTYAVSIDFRMKEGRKLINSRKQLKTPPTATATTTQTVASGVATAEAAAKRKLDFQEPLQTNSKKMPSVASAVPPKRKLDRVLPTLPLQSSLKKRAKTTKANADTASTTAKVTLPALFKANPSDSLESDEEPTAKTTIEIHDSSSSDSEDTPGNQSSSNYPGVRNDGTGFMDERYFI